MCYVCFGVGGCGTGFLTITVRGGLGDGEGRERDEASVARCHGGVTRRMGMVHGA